MGIPAPVATLGIAQSGREGDVAVLRFADQQNGWAGVGKLFSTHDGGAHWQRITLPGLVGVIANIETGGGYVFAATDGCPSLGSSRCSQTTRVYASPIGKDDWQPITGTLAGGGDAGLVVHGAEWWSTLQHGIVHGSGPNESGVLASPCPGTARPTLAVADATHLDALCIGNGAAGSAEYQLYGTTDGGRTWTKAGPTHVEPSGVYGMADNTKGVLLVASASGNSQILRTTDDGGSFGSVLTADSGGAPWADLGFTTPSQAVVVLPGSALYLSHDSGRSFTRVAIG
ncbi:MAG: hypothetical protein ACTHMS_11360 [Jatrophihabitans sp.]|uniref:WD40/YVTN/BNR-like repeat-containing protein n=1 Tax=Jatrophihabitans sp. TaxID=1932789 RepID=UPI003F80F220